MAARSCTFLRALEELDEVLRKLKDKLRDSFDNIKGKAFGKAAYQRKLPELD